MKTKLYTLLVLFVGCASWASAEELNYTKSAVQLSYTKPAVQLSYTKSAVQLSYTKPAVQLNYTKSRKVTKKPSRAISGRSLTRAQASRSTIIFDDNHFKAHPNVVEAHGRTKVRSHGQVLIGPLGGDGVFIGPLGGDGVFIGPLGGDGVFTTVLDRMMTGELSNVGKLDEDFNIVLTPGDLASMQEQALKTGDVKVLGLVIIVLRQLDDLFWWTLDGSNL